MESLNRDLCSEEGIQNSTINNRNISYSCTDGIFGITVIEQCERLEIFLKGDINEYKEKINNILLSIPFKVGLAQKVATSIATLYRKENHASRKELKIFVKYSINDPMIAKYANDEYNIELWL